MPLATSGRHAMLACATLVLSALLAGCGGGGDTGNGTAVQMTDLDKADGTINDAMTDLDGVRVEGTAVADASSTNGATGNTASPAAPSNTSSKEEPATGESEVVAQQ